MKVTLFPEAEHKHNNPAIEYDTTHKQKALINMLPHSKKHRKQVYGVTHIRKITDFF